jgi:hypothetical protein
MGLEQNTAREIVDKAVTHRWGIPEFQRGFVWTPQKVRDLVDSLWRGYPIGSFLIWYGGDYEESRTADDARAPDAWVVDGQQRTTALCVLFGRKPFWWVEDWNDALQRHDVRFDVLADADPYFSLKTAAMRGPGGSRWVPVRQILNADDETLTHLIQDLLQQLGLPQPRFGGLWTRLDTVRRLRDTAIPVVSVTLDLEDVTEIFARLNSAGTKVTEADIALALAASQNPGWARDKFLPFLKNLGDVGFELDPNLVFRSCVGIGLGKARLKDVPKGYWKSDQLGDAWEKTDTAWRRVVQYVAVSGILSAEVLPTKTALIPVAILADRFENALGTQVPIAWLLHATRQGRYSGAALTALEQDAQAINGAASAQAALDALRAKLPAWEPFTAEDFLQDYRDRPLRLVLYLVMYDRGARDWVTKQRLGFYGAQLLKRFNPDWHHIFPRAYLRKEHIREELWNVFANIAVVAPKTNIRFGAQNPMGYLDRYKVDDDLLREQLVSPDRSLLKAERYESFLRQRAHVLAQEANNYFERLYSRTATPPQALPAGQPRASLTTSSSTADMMMSGVELSRPLLLGRFRATWIESFGDNQTEACQKLLGVIGGPAARGLFIRHTAVGRPVVRLKNTAAGSFTVLQVARNHPAIRSSVAMGHRLRSRRGFIDAMDEFKKDLLKTPGAWTDQSGRVHVPVQQAAENPEPVIAALKRLREAIG